MSQSFKAVLVEYLRIHRRWLLPIFAFPWVWKLVFLATPVRTALSASLLKEKGLLILLLGPLFFSEVLLSFGLALTFKRKGNESWFARIPIRDVVFASIPYFLLFTHALMIYSLSPIEWNFSVEVTGFPVILLLGLIPVSAYLIARSTKNSTMGILSGFLMVGLIIGFTDLFRRFASGDFRSLQGGGILFEQSYLSPAVELFCLGIVFSLALFFEKKKKPLVLTLSLGVLATLSVSGILLFNFCEQKRSLDAYIQPLDEAVKDSFKNQVQCEKFHAFVEHTVGDRSTEPLRNREEFLEALQELKNYPVSSASFRNLSQYVTQVPDGLAEGMVLKKLFNTYGCHTISLYDLQRSLIGTLTKKPFYISDEEARAAEMEIWSNLKKTSETARTLIQVTANGAILRLLSENGMIPDSHKLEILELVNGFDEDRRNLSQLAYSVWSFRVPSKERVHSMLVSMQKELALVDSSREKLNQLILKIGQPKVKEG